MKLHQRAEAEVGQVVGRSCFGWVGEDYVHADGQLWGHCDDGGLSSALLPSKLDEWPIQYHKSELFFWAAGRLGWL